MSATTRPTHLVPYRAEPKARDCERFEIENMLVTNVIEPAKKESVSPVVFASKKDGALMFYADYRKRNAVAIHDSYPLPSMEEGIGSLGDTEVFSTLDALRGCWQIEANRFDLAKKSFTSHQALYNFPRTPFGMENDSATFKRVMDIIQPSIK